MPLELESYKNVIDQRWLIRLLKKFQAVSKKKVVCTDTSQGRHISRKRVALIAAKFRTDSQNISGVFITGFVHMSLHSSHWLYDKSQVLKIYYDLITEWMSS